MIILYKPNNHCLEGRVQEFLKPIVVVHKHDIRQCKVCYVKQRTQDTDYSQLLSDVYTFGMV